MHAGWPVTQAKWRSQEDHIGLEALCAVQIHDPDTVGSTRNQGGLGVVPGKRRLHGIHGAGKRRVARQRAGPHSVQKVDQGTRTHLSQGARGGEGKEADLVHQPLRGHIGGLAPRELPPSVQDADRFGHLTIPFGFEVDREAATVVPVPHDPVESQSKERTCQRREHADLVLGIRQASEQQEKRT